MYLLLLVSPLGATDGSSTCENVRSASTPYRPVTQSAHGPQHPPGDEMKRLGATPLSSDSFTRCKCEIGRPVWVPAALSVNRATAVIQQLGPASLPRRMDGWDQWWSFRAVTVQLWEEFALRVLSDTRKDPSICQLHLHLTLAAGFSSVHPVVNSQR